MLSIIELEADEIDIAEKQLESASNNGQFRYKSKAGSNRGGGGLGNSSRVYGRR